MSADLQAKYDALARMFIGDQPNCPQDTIIAIHRDLDKARVEKIRHQHERAKATQKVLNNSHMMNEKGAI